MTISCERLRPVERGNAHNGILNEHDNTMTFNIKVEVSSDKNYVMTADLFRLLMKERKNTKFRFPPLLIEQMISETDVFLASDIEICNEKMRSIDNDHFWDIDKCDEHAFFTSS